MSRRRRAGRRSEAAAQHLECGCTGMGLVMAQVQCDRCAVITAAEWWGPTSGAVGDVREVGLCCVWCGADLFGVGMIVDYYDGFSVPPSSV